MLVSFPLPSLRMLPPPPSLLLCSISPDSAPTATSIYCPDNQACKCAPSGVSVRALLCGPSWGVWQWVSGLRE